MINPGFANRGKNANRIEDGAVSIVSCRAACTVRTGLPRTPLLRGVRDPRQPIFQLRWVPSDARFPRLSSRGSPVEVTDPSRRFFTAALVPSGI